MTQRRNQTEHDSIVASVANSLRANGFSEIKADLQGYDQPIRIIWESTEQGHIPDLSAVKDQQQHIFEVETGDTITIQHTADQWKLFSTYANQHNSIFYVVVPKGYASQAQKQLQVLNLKATVLES